MYTPPRISLIVTRKSKIHPYVFVQGNLVRTNTDFTNTVHHVVPGLGLNGLYQFASNLVLRPQFQVGYNWNKQFVSESNGWVIEAKLGIGLNTNLFKRKKKEI